MFTLHAFYILCCSNNIFPLVLLPTVQILCPVLPNPTNGDVSVPSRSPGGIATYSCNAGYALSNLQRRVCLLNGVWSGSQPTCK